MLKHPPAKGLGIAGVTPHFPGRPEFTRGKATGKARAESHSAQCRGWDGEKVVMVG